MVDTNLLIGAAGVAVAAITLVRGYLMKPTWAPQSSLEILRNENQDLHRNCEELRAQIAHHSVELARLRELHKNCEMQLADVQRQYFEILRTRS